MASSYSYTVSQSSATAAAPLEKYRVRIRDVMYETLRSSAALAYVCARSIDAINSQHSFFDSHEFMSELPGWFSRLNKHCQDLEFAQTNVGRDLRFLVRDPATLHVIDTIERSTDGFDLTKPHSMNPQIDNKIAMVHKEATSHLATSTAYQQNQSREANLAVIHKTVTSSQATRPVLPQQTPTPNTAMNRSQSQALVAPRQAENAYLLPNKSLSPAAATFAVSTVERTGGPAFEQKTATPSQDYRANGQLQNLSFSPSFTPSRRPDETRLSYSISGIQQPKSSVKRVEEVDVLRGNRYSIRDEPGRETEYNSPVEGFIQTLDERNAKVSQQLSNMPSTYLRVTKEYTGESYIIKGRIVSPDGSRTKSVRQSVRGGSTEKLQLGYSPIKQDTHPRIQRPTVEDYTLQKSFPGSSSDIRQLNQTVVDHSPNRQPPARVNQPNTDQVNKQLFPEDLNRSQSKDPKADRYNQPTYVYQPEHQDIKPYVQSSYRQVQPADQNFTMTTQTTKVSSKQTHGVTPTTVTPVNMTETTTTRQQSITSLTKNVTIHIPAQSPTPPLPIYVPKFKPTRSVAALPASEPIFKKKEKTIETLDDAHSALKKLDSEMIDISSLEDDSRLISRRHPTIRHQLI